MIPPFTEHSDLERDVKRLQLEQDILKKANELLRKDLSIDGTIRIDGRGVLPIHRSMSLPRRSIHAAQETERRP
jgi:hypothetical protein